MDTNQETPTAANNPVKTISPEKALVLLAEDEEDARLIYIDIIKDNGLNIEGAKNGQSTLDMLAAKKYDMLLLDIIMPDIDGISVLADIKAEPDKYGTPIVVMLTNIGGDLAIEKALAIGADGYMLKSETDPQELTKTIRRYLEGERHVRPQNSVMSNLTARL